LWKARNDRVFNNQITDVGEIVNDIKGLSWRFWIGSSWLRVCTMKVLES